MPGGPRQWRRSLLQVIPTGKEVERIPRLLPKPDPDEPGQGDLVAKGTKYRVFNVVPTVNAAPFDKDAISGTLIIQGGGKAWGGIGEPTIAVAAPAVLNAIYRATGKRLRDVPLKKSGFVLV